MSKHTPGPWTAVANEWDEVLAEKDRGNDWYIITEKEEVIAKGLGKTDARLITATPDLLDLARNVAGLDLAYVEKIEGPTLVVNAIREWIEQARAAIAKAEGGS